MQFKVFAKDKAQAVLFTVNLSINNDFQDPITDPEHDALLEGESVIFLENDPDNNTSFVFDFNPVDADSYPNHELRPDYNASESGNPTNGGSIFYLLGGDDAGLFTVDENGSVFFKTPPDYESPLSKAAQNSSSNSSPEVRNTYYLDVTIHDSPLDLDAEVPDNTTEETYKLIVKVYDGQVLPYRKSLKTTYSIRTLENQDWNFDGEDEDGVPFRNTINLSVFDDDVGSQIWWKTIKQPTIAEKIEGDLLISGGSENSPNTFIYSPKDYSYGEDNFTIAYTDDNETFFEILFLVSVANDADPPKLGYKKDGVNDVFFTKFSAVDPVVNDQFTFEIEVPENTPFSLELPFSDSIDQQHISSVVKTGRDQNQFTISEPYQIEKYLDTNPYLWWVDLNWSAEMLPDFEELPNDGVYKVALVPRDEGDDTSSEEYSFEFVITDVDEAPVIYPRPENIAQPYEANETAVYGIHAIDPENPDDNSTYYFWSITQDEKEFFVLRDSDNPEMKGKVNVFAKNVDLVFEQLPNFEDPLKNDFNVTIAVEQVEQSEDDEDTELRSSSQYHIQVKGNNDPPVLNPDAQSLSIDEIIDKSLTGPYSGANSGDQESSWFLDNLFTDEDEDALAYYIELEPGHEGKPSLQDHLFIKTNNCFSAPVRHLTMKCSKMVWGR